MEFLLEQEPSSFFSDAPPDAMAAARPEFRERVNNIPVEIEVVIGRAKVSVAELMRADQGYSFSLDKRFGEPVELLVNGRLIGFGELVSDKYENVIGVRVIRLAG
ncbi:FliM/FliN family flagellar motor switch protein [Sinorhizobium meliloti]|uniref:FliM/FliN family flagellar motor switch protein n=1 Tax=Rhizobium meliloti TaxID=382 RepID=UPI0020904540|nr:FliM/FliN family flagellar motor switch protein [Sinorhizobium meliloti]MCO5965400.1 FliM/FliN family flagellar motor switch protein [Sinorhizobium meliloti]